MATKRFVSKDNLGRVWARLFGKVLNSKEEIEANKSENMIAGADAVKEVYSSLANGRVQLVVNDDSSLGYKLDGADTVYPFSNGLNAIITVRSVSAVYSSVGNKHGDTLLDTQFTIKNGKVESTKVITNEGTSAGGWSIKPEYSSILSIKDNK